MKLYDQWLACDDGRTLSEFVADVRQNDRAARHQRRMYPYLAEQARLMQNSAPLWAPDGLQNLYQQNLMRQFGGPGSLGGLLGNMLGFRTPYR